MKLRSWKLGSISPGIRSGRIACRLREASLLVRHARNNRRSTPTPGAYGICAKAYAWAMCSNDAPPVRPPQGKGGGQSEGSFTRARRQGPGASDTILTPAAETLHDTMHAIGPGHDLWRAGQVFFCKRCACHGDVRAKGLLAACCADPAKLGSKATILNRLKNGCHPRSKEYLGAPVRALAKNNP